MDKYEVIGEIGKGSFGSISKIIRKNDKQILIWKELKYEGIPDEEKQLIANEINLLREMNHTNIVKQYGTINDYKNSKLYMVMEYCDGGDLGKFILKNKLNKKLIDEQLIWKILIQILRAIDYIHNEKKILHRDIKPSNIFFDLNFNFKLGDFGLSKKFYNEYSNTFIGTPLYLSPEVLEIKPYNVKSDIWAFGCTLYELATFVRPYEASNINILLSKIKNGLPQRIDRTYSDELWNMIAKMLTYDYNKRPSSKELIEEYNRIFASKQNINNNKDDIQKKWEELNLYKERIEKELKEKEIRIKSREHLLNTKETELIKKEKELIEMQEKLEKQRKEQKEKEIKLKMKEKELNEKERKIKEFSIKNQHIDDNNSQKSINENNNQNNFNNHFNLKNKNQINLNENQDDNEAKFNLDMVNKFINSNRKNSFKNIFEDEDESDDNNIYFNSNNNNNNNNINNYNGINNNYDINNNNNINNNNSINNNNNINNNIDVDININIDNNNNYNNYQKNKLPEEGPIQYVYYKNNKMFPKIGLENKDNTSYLNAILNILGNTEELAFYFLNPIKIEYFDNKKREMPLSYEIKNFFQNYYPRQNNIMGNNTYDPSSLLLNVKRCTKNELTNPNFFLKDLFSSLNSELIPQYKDKEVSIIKKFDKQNSINNSIELFEEKNKSPIFDIFNFYKICESKCFNCYKAVAKYIYKDVSYLYLKNSFTFKLDISGCYSSLEKKEFTLTIKECLDYQLQKYKESLKSLCKECQQHKSIISNLYSSPKIFLFLLDRGSNFDENENELLNIPFLIEEKLDLEKFIENKNSPTKYELVGIVSISLSDKKYVAHSKSPIDNNWYYFNDLKVQKIEHDNVIKVINNNYYYIPCILVYKSINDI